MKWILRATCLALALSACAPVLCAQQPEDDTAAQAELELKAHQQLQARQDLDAGMAAFQSGNYAQAIDHFKNAIYLDESLATDAKLQIALAYARQYKPGAQDPDNLRMAQQAIAQYREILEQDPRNLESLRGISSLYTQMGNFAEARDSYLQLLEYTPDDPQPYYLVGMIDWTMAYADTERRKSAVGLKVDDPLERPEDQKLCGEISDANQMRVQEGLKMLRQANERRPDYEETFAYFALLYRREADIACNDKAARASSLKLSAEWADKALAAQKKKESPGKGAGPPR
jgi:tetratricopeptide (TPR) repeat protein